MEYRNLGRSGVKVSAVGLGCNQLGTSVDRDATRALVHAALDQGINFFDTADTYGDRGGSEELLGAALAGQWQRVVVASKGRHRMGEGPNYVIPYSPLAGGFLTGKYRRSEPPPSGTRGQRSPYVQKYLTGPNFDLLDRLRPIAERNGRTLAELAIAWLLAQAQVCSVIAGATRPEQVTQNANAASWVLAADDLRESSSFIPSASSQAAAGRSAPR